MTVNAAKARAKTRKPSVKTTKKQSNIITTEKGTKAKAWAQVASVFEKKPLPELFNRAKKRFEKKSGWKSVQVDRILENFSRLDGKNKVFLGGLLVGKALLPNKQKSKLSASKA